MLVMAKEAVATTFRRNEKVRALDDLPGVPQGMTGRVELVAGFTWIRYRVAFDNGVDLGSIEGRHLARAKQYEAALRQREEAASAPVEVASSNGAVGEEAAASAGEDKTVNGVAVPGHLLERSKRARERLAA
jgi:hypothetical protein